MTHIQEEWKPVVGFEDCYDVSSEGRVRRSTPARGTRAGKVLKPHLAKRGYCQVSIHPGSGRRELYVHSMVAAAFLGPRPPRCDVNHIDGDKTNNHLGNLEYATRQQNLAHASRLGLLRVGEDFGRSPLRNQDVLSIRNLASTLRVTVIARCSRSRLLM